MKKLLSILLALTITLSLSVTFSAKSTDETDSAYAENNSQTFTDIEAVRKKINDIYKDNFEYFKNLAIILRSTISGDDYFTYKANCGPCSTAFQKVLYENGITVENQRPNISRDHVFNLLRTSYTSSPNIETDIVIDTTYKQFITGAYTSAGYTFTDMSNELPNVLIYEYGNYEQLCEQLSGLTKRFGETTAQKLFNAVYENNYGDKYPISDLQEFYDTSNKLNHTSKFFEDIKKNNGKKSIVLDDKLILSSTSSDLEAEFVYDENGVYRCYLSNEDAKLFANGFTINNNNNEIIYGAEQDNTTLNFIPTDRIFANNCLYTLQSSSTKPMYLNISIQQTSNFILCLDFGSGIETPSVYIFPVTVSYYYGDVNKDGVVNVSDITYLQQCISKEPGLTLDLLQQSIADVTKTEALNINNATAIALKLAEIQDFDCGEKIYFSQSLKAGINQFGYIDF